MSYLKMVKKINKKKYCNLQSDSQPLDNELNKTDCLWSLAHDNCQILCLLPLACKKWGMGTPMTTAMTFVPA